MHTRNITHIHTKREGPVAEASRRELGWKRMKSDARVSLYARDTELEDGIDAEPADD